MTNVNSGHILDALLKTHGEHYTCIPECKDGESGYGMVRMDLLCIRKSWANPGSIGYEIKVSKSDFQRDDKWQKYLKMCNEFYFVTPRKMIDSADVPDPCGLKWYSTSGNIITRKKAAVREIPWHVDTLRYIIMCRCQIVEQSRYEPTDKREQRLAFWREWLQKKEVNHGLGMEVSSALYHKLINNQINLENVNKILKERVEKLQVIQDLVYKTGITTWDRSDSAIRKILEYLDPSKEVAQRIKREAERMMDMASHIESLQSDFAGNLRAKNGEEEVIPGAIE